MEYRVSAVGRGSLLAGRYRLEEQLTHSETSSLWRGVDTTLDRRVAVRLVSPKTAAETLDAARRAALVDDHRLVRLLDVAQQTSTLAGQEARQTYVVSEWVEGQSIADLLQSEGPLPPERVRTLIGEASEGLAIAAARGLHHLALDPTSVLVAGDGSVRVHGLGVDAAARGGAQPTGEAAERVDAVGLVALIYAGLTGRWPLATSSHHDPLETAPMVGNAAVPPADVVSGVPADLNRLCVETFGPSSDRAGAPASPAEVADRLKPWSSRLEPSTANRRLADDLRAAPARPASRFPVALTSPEDFEEEAGAAGEDGSGNEPTPAQPWSPFESSPPERTVSPAAEDERSEPSLLPDHDRGEDDADEKPAPVEERRGSSRRRFGWLPLAVVAVLVVVGLVLAYSSLSGGGSGPATTATQSSATTTATTSAAVGVAPKIAEVTAFDPEGDNSENDSQAPRAADGDPSTSWRSSRYNSAALGNLKSGVGLVVRLEEPSSIGKVSLSVGGEGGTVEIRTASGASLDGSQVIASGPAGTLEKTLDPAPTAQYLIIWFTQLPSVDGQYRAEVNEITVS